MFVCVYVCTFICPFEKSREENQKKTEKNNNEKKELRMRIVTRQNCMAINITESVAEAWTSVNRIRLCAR